MLRSVFTFLLLSLGLSVSAQVLTLRGTVTRADFETYKEIPFTVPAGVTRLSVEYSYDHEQHTVIDIGIEDPQRMRGWAGGAKSAFTLSESDTTPSFLPGPIVPGEWKILFGIPNIREGVAAKYEVKIAFAHAGDVPAMSAFSSEPLRHAAGWYRGDLHAHTGHSDAKCQSEAEERVGCPLYKTVEAAEARGLDFIAITDHNTTAHFSEVRALQPFFDHLLLIPGREVTTFFGHANVFGTTEPIDFRVNRTTAAQDFLRIEDRVATLHGFLSVNHPNVASGESCMGCGWTMPGTDWAKVGAIEAINGSDADTPVAGIRFWQSRLNEGFRLTAIGGSDNHDALTGTVGTPTTVVYANELSERAVLDGIRAGHVYLDVDGTRDRGMEWTAELNGKRVMMGDSLLARAGQKIEFTLVLHGVPQARPRLIVDGDTYPSALDAVVEGNEGRRGFSYTSLDEKRHWLRVEVRSMEGKLLLLGNPIYLNAR